MDQNIFSNLEQIYDKINDDNSIEYEFKEIQNSDDENYEIRINC